MPLLQKRRLVNPHAPTMDDPFSIVFQALWDMIDASVPLSAMVKPGNKIRFNNNDWAPLKDSVMAADMPELILNSSGSSEAAQINSAGRGITRIYQWQISTGNFNIDQGLFPVQWAVFSAMADYAEALTQLKWRNNFFVLKCDLVSITEGISDEQANRGIRGWAALWSAQVMMNFSIADMQLYNKGQ